MSNICFRLFTVALLGFSTLFSEEFVLTVSPERAEIIEEIVTTMGQTNVIVLKFKEKHLRNLSKQLHGMGSLNFLGHIFTHGELRENMEYIRGSYFKWEGFMGSVRKGFDRQKAAGTLFEEIPGFAALFNVNAAALATFAESSDWDGFVYYLMDNMR